MSVIGRKSAEAFRYGSLNRIPSSSRATTNMAML
jgi:hypothetical protein